MRKTRRLPLFILSLFVVLSCSRSEENAVPLEVDFHWNPPCTDLFMSPEIRLGPIPEGTASFYVTLIDLDLPAFDHGNGFAQYENQSILPAGAVRGSYAGPSPPHGVTHRYEIKVRALDKDRKVLAVGKKVLPYPPDGEEEVRWSPCGERETKARHP